MSIYPKLILPQFTKTEVRIISEVDEYDENGSPKILLDANFKGNFQAGNKRVLNEKHNTIERVSTLYLDGDVLGDVSSGECFIYNKKYNIKNIIKARNPDGTVNFTEVELI